MNLPIDESNTMLTRWPDYETTHRSAASATDGSSVRGLIRLIGALALFTLPGLATGCRDSAAPLQADREHPAPANATAETPAKSAASEKPSTPLFPMKVTDGLGREVSLPNVPQRIISLAPRNTEMLFALDAGGQVVGVTSYCNFPPSARLVEQVGGFKSKSVSLERIVSLKPDLVVTVGDLHAPIIQELERLGLSVLALTGDSSAALFEELQMLGRITGHPDKAAILVKDLQDRIGRVTRVAARIPAPERVTVYYQIWDEPLTAAGPTAFISELIRLGGGVNVFDDTQERFPKISLEVLLARDPQVIVTSTNHIAFFAKENLDARPGWRDLRAVRTTRVHLLDGDLVSRCGPRLADALELVAHALYPDHFPDPRAETSSDGKPDSDAQPAEASPDAPGRLDGSTP